MKENWQIAEEILNYAVETQDYIRKLDKQFEKIVFESGPSGYVGCSHECRGQGQRRRSGSMEDISKVLMRIGINKDKAIISIKPLIDAFEKMKRTRSGHVIYYRVGKKIGVQDYADRFGYSRRHSRRLYIRAMEDLYSILEENGGMSLIEKFNG